MDKQSSKFQPDDSDDVPQQHASFVSALGAMVRNPTHLVSLVVAFITGMAVVGASVIGRHGGGSSPTTTTTAPVPTTAVRVPAPEPLRVGGLYYMFAPSDAVLWQVVDVRTDPRLQQPDVVHPTGSWDVNTLWVDQDGFPVYHREKPLGPAAGAVAAAFGSSDKLAAFLRTTLKPLS